jgi:predicted small lipoprotein YifL
MKRLFNYRSLLLILALAALGGCGSDGGGDVAPPVTSSGCELGTTAKLGTCKLG